MASDSACLLVPMRIQEENRDILLLTRWRTKVVSNCIHSNTIQVTFPVSLFILLCNVEIPDLLHGFIRPNNVDFSFVPHMFAVHISICESARLPFFLVTECAPPHPSTVHLFSRECLPKICCHAIFPDGRLQSISFPFYPFWYCVKRCRRIPTQEYYQF